MIFLCPSLDFTYKLKLLKYEFPADLSKREITNKLSLFSKNPACM